jgi:NAD(P)-dependent dehydrogenase (short-subunit alcohol dehydrogenase family)
MSEMSPDANAAAPTAFSLRGRSAIVTGAAQGIGAVYADALAAAGAAVTALDVIPPTDVVDRISARGSTAFGEVVDITDEDAVVAAVGRVRERTGSVDILVNNAALFGTLKHSPVLELSAADFDRVMRVNVTGQFICAKAVIPHMREAGWGRIVNISSGAALKGIPMMLHYTTSKGAVVAFTRALAREVGNDGITVNAIAPGLTQSESVKANPIYRSTPLQNRAIDRDQLPEDLLGPLVFLCSDAAAFITGQTIAVDGGSVML